MNTPFILPTLTQRVRTFLADQGAVLRPWAGLQETYDELYALMRRRRNDPDFWPPLKCLLEDVIRSAVDPERPNRLATAQAELLCSWKVDELIDELREALAVEATAAEVGPWSFTRGLSSAVLGGFLLIGLTAAGCGTDDPSITGAGGAGGGLGDAGGQITATGGMGTGGVGTGGFGAPDAGTGGRAVAGSGGMGGNDAGATRGGGPLDAASDANRLDDAASDVKGLDDAASEGGSLDDSATDATTTTDAASDSSAGDAASEGGAQACTQNVPSALDHAIAGSTLTADSKARLCECFAALSAGWTTGLTDLFATSTPEHISKVLTNLLSCCRSDGIHTTRGTNAGPTSNDLSTIQGSSPYMLCAVPVYKGVSFPD